MWAFSNDPAANVLVTLITALEAERKAKGSPGLLSVMVQALQAMGLDGEVVSLDSRRLDPAQLEALRDALRFLEWTQSTLQGTRENPARTE